MRTFAAALILALLVAFLLAAYAPAAGISDFTHRYIEDADGRWWRVYVPTAAEFVRLAEDGRHYRLHDANRNVISWPTRGWTVYDGWTRKTTVLENQPPGALP